jgi:hypothetical protein
MAIGAIALTAHSVYLVRQSDPADFAMVEVTGATVFGMLAAVSLFANEAEKRKGTRLPDPATLPAGVQVVYLVTGTNKGIDAGDFPQAGAYFPEASKQNKNHAPKMALFPKNY